jgi:uncharacterized protein YacL
MRNLTKYSVLAISVLAASLLNEFVIGQITSLYKERSYLSVLIGMIATVFVFVPIIGLLGKYIKKFSNEYIRRSKNLGKSRMTGLLIGMGIAFILLFILFANVRHNFDVISDIKSLF